MEPLEKVRDEAEGKGGCGGVEELAGFRTTIMRLSTCSSVKELVPNEPDSDGEKARLVECGTAGAKSGTAAESGVCMKGPSLGFPSITVIGLVASKVEGAPFGDGY